MKTIVIKLGGSILDQLDSTFFSDCQQLIQEGIHPIIIHGGGPMISQHLRRLGIETRFIDGRRYTDRESLQHVVQSLAGEVNKQLVARFVSQDISAIGLSGIDLNMLQVSIKDPKWGYVGEVVEVNSQALISMLLLGWIPCIAPLGMDHKGQIYNINADEAAASIAHAVGAEKLILVSDVAGILIKKKLLKCADQTQIEEYIKTGEISGGMIPKVQAGLVALKGTVREVMIVSGKQKHLLTGDQLGTKILRERNSIHATIS